jgi:hypothetical protein
MDYGQTFIQEFGANFCHYCDMGWSEQEIFSIGADDIGGTLYHTYDLFRNYMTININPLYISKQTYAFSKVFRGGLPGEVYVDSWFPWYVYKASFSADTGQTFRHVYVTDQYAFDVYSIFGSNQLLFMSDREPGVFYILRLKQIKDTDPVGWHLQLCIEYYRDYGETLVATYCHDVHKDWVNEEEEVCTPVNDLSFEKPAQSSVLLSWTEPVDTLEISGYHIFRNHTKITEELVTENSYLDEDLPNGNYEYYVVSYYKGGCISDKSNLVTVEIEVGVKENFIPRFSIVPNPATNQVAISSANPFHTIEIINFMGQTVFSQSNNGNSATLNISNLTNGIYFVRVFFESGSSVKKLVKQ